MNAHRQFKPGDSVPGTVYRVEDLVGSGGMGSVYRVEHTELGKAFVLKALHGHLSSRDDLVARLRNEWRALAKLDHPNIVQVTDAGRTSEGLPFYVMESLEGATLSTLLSQEGRMSAQRSFAIIADVLSGLHAAHQTGAIHRDIKPPNIFVESQGATKLLDFGIAKLRDKAAKVVTAGGVSIGTPRYMAPEQADGSKVDARADIYATGLVLYEMLVGKGPFAHIRDPNELVMAHISQEPERADFIRHEIPAEVGDLLQRWLSKRPDSRPATAELARQELLALGAALPEDAADPDEDVTLAGAYDAATVGAELSQALSVKAPQDGSLLEPPGEVETPGVIATQTIAEPSLGDRASDPVGPAGTMGWGSQAELAEETRVPDAEPVAVVSGEILREKNQRRSVTPPPISSSRPSKAAPSSGSGSSLKWAMATAVISFGLALGVSQMLSDRSDSSEGGEAAAPEAPEMASSGDTDPTRDRPEKPSSSPPEAPAVAEQKDSSRDEPDEPVSSSSKASPVAPTPQKPVLAQSPKVKPTPKPVSRSSPAPVARPAPKTAPSPPKKAKKDLPGSGLW